MDIHTVEHPRAILNRPREVIIGVAEPVGSCMTRFEKTGFPATGAYVEDGVLSLPTEPRKDGSYTALTLKA